MTEKLSLTIEADDTDGLEEHILKRADEIREKRRGPPHPLAPAMLVLVQDHRQNIVDFIDQNCLALKLLKVVDANGRACEWQMEPGKPLPLGNFQEGMDAVNFGDNQALQGALNWGIYRENFQVSGRGDLTAADMSSVGVQFAAAARNLARRLNRDVFDGAGTGTRLAGLDHALGSVANTYACVDRSQTGMAPYRPFVPGETLGHVTPETIKTDLAAIYKQSGYRPRIAFLDPDEHSALCRAVDTQAREDSVETARGTVFLNHDQRGIVVEGCMFLPEKDATKGWIYYLPPGDDVCLVALPPSGDDIFRAMTESRRAPYYTIPDSDGMRTIVGSLDHDGFGLAPLGFEAQPLVRRGESHRFSVCANIQLMVRRPAAGGIRRTMHAAPATSIGIL